MADKIRGRLASTDVAALKQMEIDDYRTRYSGEQLKALERLKEVFKIPIGDAQVLYTKMVKHLTESDLTINFRTSSFFSRLFRGKVLNTFQVKGHDNASGLADRDDAEENLFGYSGNNPRRIQRPSIADRLNQFGSRSSPEFTPTMRPKYAALNYTNYPWGGASEYGNSYMVLKEHVKQNCTFTGGDSYAYRDDGAGRTARRISTFSDMERVILNMNLKALQNLKLMTDNPLNELDPVGFVEAQIHGEIRFNRDVHRMYVCASDLQTGLFKYPARWYIENFGRKNGILISYI